MLKEDLHLGGLTTVNSISANVRCSHRLERIASMRFKRLIRQNETANSTTGGYGSLYGAESADFSYP